MLEALTTWANHVEALTRKATGSTATLRLTRLEHIAYSRRLPSVRFLLLSTARLLQVQRTRASVPDLRAALPSPRIQMPASGIRLPTPSSSELLELHNTQVSQVKNKMIAELFPTASLPDFVRRIIIRWFIYGSNASH